MGTDAIGSLTQRGDGEKCQHVISTYIDSIKTYQDNPRHCISKRLKKGFHQVSFFWKSVVRVGPVRLYAACKAAERRQTGQEMPKSLAETWPQA